MRRPSGGDGAGARMQRPLSWGKSALRTRPLGSSGLTNSISGRLVTKPRNCFQLGARPSLRAW